MFDCFNDIAIRACTIIDKAKQCSRLKYVYKIWKFQKIYLYIKWEALFFTIKHYKMPTKRNLLQKKKKTSSKNFPDSSWIVDYQNFSSITRTISSPTVLYLMCIHAHASAWPRINLLQQPIWLRLSYRIRSIVDTTTTIREYHLILKSRGLPWKYFIWLGRFPDGIRDFVLFFSISKSFVALYHRIAPRRHHSIRHIDCHLIYQHRHLIGTNLRLPVLKFRSLRATSLSSKYHPIVRFAGEIQSQSPRETLERVLQIRFVLPCPEILSRERLLPHIIIFFFLVFIFLQTNAVFKTVLRFAFFRYFFHFFFFLFFVCF